MYTYRGEHKNKPTLRKLPKEGLGSLKQQNILGI